MIRSLNTGVLGIRTFQTGLDAIGNNLANINTVAYKAARVDFADTLNQTLRAPTPDTATVSGTTGMQVGNGLSITAIKNSFTQGAIKQTGVRTDLAIAGEGFFLVKDPTTNELFATRAGDFRTDKNGFLVTNGGQRVQGLNKLAPAYSDADKKQIGDLKMDVGAYMTDRTGVTVDSTTETLTKAGHGFSTGMQVRFSGTVPGTDPAITSSTVLYVRADATDSANKLSLHTTASDAAAGTNAINFTGSTGTPPTSLTGIKVDPFADQITKTAHGLVDGMEVKFKTNAPGGADLITSYYTKKIDDNTFSLHTGATPTNGNKANLTAATLTTFAVDASEDEITKNAHGFTTGDVVRFNTTAPAGANTSTSYYVRVINANKFALHSSISDASTGTDKINFTNVASGGSYGANFNRANTTTDQLTKTGHSIPTGTAVKFNTTAPTGANTTATYYARAVDANTVTLHSTAAGAVAGTGIVDLSGAPANYELLSQQADYKLDADKNTYELTGQSYSQYTLTGGASISSFNVGADGNINMLLTDGTQYVRGQVLAQNFNNTQALMKQGSNLYSNLGTAGPLGTTGNTASATEILGGAEAPGNAGLGRIESGALELSNVDMAREFATMITTQRAFQANARVISTSDEILQEMMQLKR
tara:strand:+ start:1563 stop:3506 length:1944 start_codon:yes stop_codon:yes gene_type:complete